MMFGTPVDPEASNQWGISCLNILARVFGKDSDHYQKFDGLFHELGDWINVRSGVGIMKAAKDDYEKDHLFDVKVLIQAEVFDDFLSRLSIYLIAAIISLPLLLQAVSWKTA